MVQTKGVVGLKCYHCFAYPDEAGSSDEPTACRRPTFEADIGEYLPDHLCEVASELGLTVTLHMVKARGLSDPANQRDIRRICEAYPGLRLILAHAARGFNQHHTIEALGLGALKGLDNVVSSE